MLSKYKNIIVFVGIGLVLILIYVFFIKGDSNDEQASLISTSNGDSNPGSTSAEDGGAIAQDFLSLLLNVKSINLDDKIFSDPAFISLEDSSIELVPDGTEGRPNPFAPIGSDASVQTQQTKESGTTANPPTIETTKIN